MPKIRLHTFLRSACSYPAWTALGRKDVAYDSALENLLEGGQAGPETIATSRIVAEAPEVRQDASA